MPARPVSQPLRPGIRRPRLFRPPGRFLRRLRRLAAVLALSVAAPGGAAAHDLELTETLVVLAGDGRFLVEMTCDLDALALGAGPGADDAELAGRLAALDGDALDERLAALERLFQRRVRVRFDGEPAAFAVDFPDRGIPDAPPPSRPSFLGTTARLTGHAPPAWEEMTFFASRAFPAVHLTVLDRTTLGGSRFLVERGAESETYRRGEGAPEDDAWIAAGRYLALGFRHILPEGLDHILFVLGLFLLAPRIRPLVWQVSAFTLAHTLTLALSTWGVVSLPPRLVETAIALSIAWVAVENVVTSELKPWRPAVVFAFGLLHGLGFAGALAGLGLPEGERLAALVGFNLGVELGQLAVVGAAALTLGLLRDRPWYRARIAVPLSLAIAAAGLVWALRRALGG